MLRRVSRRLWRPDGYIPTDVLVSESADSELESADSNTDSNAMQQKFAFGYGPLVTTAV